MIGIQQADKNLTIWECCQYLIKTIENKGEFETAKLINIGIWAS